MSPPPIRPVAWNESNGSEIVKSTIVRSHCMLQLSVALLLIQSGCGEFAANTVALAVRTESGELAVGKHTIQAGLLFIEESSYLCVPLKDLNIDSDMPLVRVRSSCDCVQPSVVRFRVSQNEYEAALRLNFFAEHHPIYDSSAIPLQVRVTLYFVDGSEQEMIVNLLLAAPQTTATSESSLTLERGAT
jgi:hypothetical protein